jgi:hypothetical protein
MSNKTDLEDSKCCDENMASITVHVIVDHLCCKICYDPYTEKGEKEPKVMKCGHTICSQCITMIYKKRGNVLCPFCNCVDRERPNELPKNYDLISMLHHYPQLPPNQVSLSIDAVVLSSTLCILILLQRMSNQINFICNYCYTNPTLLSLKKSKPNGPQDNHLSAN